MLLPACLPSACGTNQLRNVAKFAIIDASGRRRFMSSELHATLHSDVRCANVDAAAWRRVLGLNNLPASSGPCTVRNALSCTIRMSSSCCLEEIFVALFLWRKDRYANKLARDFRTIGIYSPWSTRSPATSWRTLDMTRCCAHWTMSRPRQIDGNFVDHRQIGTTNRHYSVSLFMTGSWHDMFMTCSWHVPSTIDQRFCVGGKKTVGLISDKSVNVNRALFAKCEPFGGSVMASVVVALRRPSIQMQRSAISCG